MKKLAILLAVILMMSTILPAFAEGGMGPSEGAAQKTPEELAAEAEAEAKFNSPLDFQLIEADEATGQIRLTYLENVTPILEVGGLKFKDMNKNGQLDVYEDWRKDTEERVWDLIAQLTPEEEAGLHFCGQPEPIYNAREEIENYYLYCILFNLNGSPATIVNNLNQTQAVSEEQRLGIPMTFASDRAFNSFGGYIDMAHKAFGTASSGSTSITTTVKNQAKAGVPFAVYCLLNNNGADDLTTVQAKANGEVVAEKLYTVQGGSWRVVEIELTLEAGEYEIQVGDAIGSVTVTE